MPSLVPKHNLPKNDLVYTPENIAISIINHFSPKGKILDPCKGSGVFYDNYPKECEKDWCEISEGRDFFDYDEKVNWIVTNPPWSMMREFLEKGYDVADNIVYLSTITHFCTKNRLKTMREKDFGIKEILLINTPPKPWPQSGFQVAAVHLQKGYKNDSFSTIN